MLLISVKSAIAPTMEVVIPSMENVHALLDGQAKSKPKLKCM
jgi:hypothetical protein